MSFAICGIPELPTVLRPPVSHVISFLDPTWPEPLGLLTWPADRRHLFRYDDVLAPGPGLVVPDEALIERLVTTFEQIASEAPSRLLIHCHAGRSRSTATALLWLWQTRGPTASELAETLLAKRQGAWPNSLILELADQRLKTGGVLQEAGRLVHCRTVRDDPEFIQWLSNTPRKPEVTAALRAAE